jgi:hypothetical protein
MSRALLGLKYDELQIIPTCDRYQWKVKLSEISKLVVYFHITNRLRGSSL